MSASASGLDLALLLAEKGLAAALATLGFAVLFNVPRYALPYCALVGALAYALRTALMQGGAGLVLATLLAALLIGLLSTALAQRFAVSVTLFAVGPAIPLVPGSYAYKAVLGVVKVANAPGLEGHGDLLLAALDDGIRATVTVLFLSLGIALPGLVWTALWRGR